MIRKAKEAMKRKEARRKEGREEDIIKVMIKEKKR